MLRCQWISLDESERWDAAVRSCGRFDSYHLSTYHRVVSSQNERFVGCGGEPFLFVYDDMDVGVGEPKNRLRFVVPILRRRLSSVPGLELVEGYDAVSAYGYPGLLVSDCGEYSESAAVRSRFQAAFFSGLRELGVVSFFGRCHPLFPTERFWYAGMTEVRRTGQTVALDLSLSEEEQQRQLRRDTRARLRQAHAAGVTIRVSSGGDIRSGEVQRGVDVRSGVCGTECVGGGDNCAGNGDSAHRGDLANDHVRASTDSDIDLFMRLYNTTMRSVGASSGYFFERTYYEQLFAEFGSQRVRMLFAEYEGEVVASAIFLLSVAPEEVFRYRDAVIQYHLSGSITNANTRRWGGGTRSILNWMRRFGSSYGYRWLHLGGGLGGRGPGDPLFDFKAGFSKRYFEFDTVRWVIDPEKYERLVSHRLSACSVAAREAVLSSGFFPLYRGF